MCVGMYVFISFVSVCILVMGRKTVVGNLGKAFSPTIKRDGDGVRITFMARNERGEKSTNWIVKVPFRKVSRITNVSIFTIIRQTADKPSRNPATDIETNGFVSSITNMKALN